MVQAAILQMKPPGVLTRWLNEGKCTKAHYSSEMGESNHAHFQGWHQWETEQPQSEVPDALLELARTTMGSKKKDQEQKVRNTREKKAISELRQWLRADVVVAFIDQEQCSYTCMINIIKEGDEEKTMGYPGKEEGQIHLRSAVIGIGDADLRSAIEFAQAEAGNGRAANDKQNHNPGSRKKRKMLTRKNESLTSSWFEWREGIDLLDLPLEQVVRYMIRRGWQVDGQYLAATIHEPRTPSRVNACHMLHKYPQICDKPESQKLINLVIYGESARNHTGADLDLDFGEARETACPGMPSFQQLYSLSLEEAKRVQATQRMPDGGVATLREAYRHGDALIVDTRATHGGRSIDAQQLLKEHKLKTRSLTTTNGTKEENSYVVAQCAHAVLELGELFVVNFGAQQVQQHAGLASAVELLQAIELVDDDEELPRLPEQLPMLTSMAIELYAGSATLIAPTVFEGVLSYHAFHTLVAKSMANLSVDANSPPVHVAVVESCPADGQQSEHHFLAAWRMDPGHARDLTRPHLDDGNAMPPGLGAGADADDAPFFGADDGDDDDALAE